jgi:hypothetical protein
MKFLMFAFALLSLGGFIFGVYDSMGTYSSWCGPGPGRCPFDFSGFIIFWSCCSVPLIVLLIFKSIYGDEAIDKMMDEKKD